MTPFPIPSGSREDHVALIQNALTDSRAKTPQAFVLAILGNALEAVRHLPDAERRFLLSGTRSSFFDLSGMSRQEVATIEKIRVLAGIRPNSAAPMKTTRGAEDALLAVEWLRFLRSAKDATLHDAFLLLLEGDHRMDALRVWRPNRAYSRTSISELRTKGVQTILRGLRREFSIDIEEIFQSAKATAI